MASTAIANAVGSLAVLLSTLFGGFLMTRHEIMGAMAWISNLSFVRCACGKCWHCVLLLTMNGVLTHSWRCVLLRNSTMSKPNPFFLSKVWI